VKIPLSSRAARAGVAVTAVGLAAGGYGIAWATSGAGAATTAGPGAATLSAASAPGGSSVPPAGPGRGRHGHALMAGGTVTAVGADSLTVQGPGGRTHTVATDSATTYSRDGHSAPRSVLAVGERVRIMLVRQAAAPGSAPGASGSAPSATNPTASRVDVVDPRVGGTVQSVNGSVITIADPEGFWRTVDTDGSTKFLNGTQTASLSAVQAGQHVAAFGTIASDHTTLNAIEVRIIPAPASGSTAAGPAGVGPAWFGGGGHGGPGFFGPGGPGPAGPGDGSGSTGAGAGV